jgi:hypothetical protein
MAEKLRDAGYPQPSQYSSGYYLRYYRANSKIISELGFECYGVDVVYAPAATELLASMEGYSLRRRANWECWNDKEVELISSDENPHDCAALAWLHESKPIEV